MYFPRRKTKTKTNNDCAPSLCFLIYSVQTLYSIPCARADCKETLSLLHFPRKSKIYLCVQSLTLTHAHSRTQSLDIVIRLHPINAETKQKTKTKNLKQLTASVLKKRSKNTQEIKRTLFN